jgi:hypothetical protein
MIVSVVRFKLAEPLSRDEATSRFLENSPRYLETPGLFRKQFLLSEDGSHVGGVYLWKSREDGEACFNGEWRERLVAKHGTEPVIDWFDCSVMVDNRHHDRVTDVA